MGANICIKIKGVIALKKVIKYITRQRLLYALLLIPGIVIIKLSQDIHFFLGAIFGGIITAAAIGMLFR